MSEPTPQLHLPREHVMALTQVLNQLGSYLADARRRREQEARRAVEGSARITPASGAPATDADRSPMGVRPRPMSDDERGAFEHRAGPVPEPHPDRVVASAAPLGDGAEWGVRASTPDGQSAHVALPNEDVATGLASSLEERNDVRDVPALSTIAADPASAVTNNSAPSEIPDQVPGLASRVPSLPASVTDDPGWAGVEQQFQQRVADGADPDQLADAVGKLDFDAARFPSSLAGWEIDRVAARRGGDSGNDGRDADRSWAFSQLVDAEVDGRRERDEAGVARSDQRAWDEAMGRIGAADGDGQDDAPAAEASGTELGATVGPGDAEAAQEDAAQQIANHEGRAADAAGQGETLRDGALARSLSPTPEARAADQRAPASGSRASSRTAPAAANAEARRPRPQRRRFGR